MTLAVSIQTCRALVRAGSLAGLPPGPIAAPGKGSLEAAANPANNEFLYFVSRNDGTHEFARTLSEHNRNVQKFQIQYFRDLRDALGDGPPAPAVIGEIAARYDIQTVGAH